MLKFEAKDHIQSKGIVENTSNKNATTNNPTRIKKIELRRRRRRRRRSVNKCVPTRWIYVQQKVEFKEKKREGNKLKIILCLIWSWEKKYEDILDINFH